MNPRDHLRSPPCPRHKLPPPRAQRDVYWIRERCVDGWAAIARGADSAVPCNTGNRTIRRHNADSLIAGRSDVDVAVHIDGDARRSGDPSLSSRTIIARETPRSAPRDGRDGSTRHFAYPVIASVGDIQITSGIHRDSGRDQKKRARGGAPRLLNSQLGGRFDRRPPL